MRAVDIIIIGAGPAGIAAAVEAAKLGVVAVILDENTRPGGQIYRRLADPFVVTDIGHMGEDYAQGTRLIEELGKQETEFIDNAVVWGVFADKELAFMRQGKNETLKAQALIISEGAYDRSIPFPGWTLPGVMTAGAALRMVKTGRILPGKKILLSGTGPLQLALGAQLVRFGAEVTAVLEANSLLSLSKFLPRLFGQWKIFADGLRYFWELQKSKVQLLTSHAIVRAHGSEEVEEATYARLDKDWKPITGTEETVEVDTICSGYGLVPSIRISKLCGCAHHYIPHLGGWLPIHNDCMETSQPGVFVAGDCAGIEGALVAIEEGRLAAINACKSLGHISQKESRRLTKPMLKRLRGLRRFESALGEISAIRKGLFNRITDETVVCRCEEVTAGEIRKNVSEGITEMSGVKRLTRTGMGLCQGRICEDSVAEILSMETGRPREEIGFFVERPPIRIIPLEILANEEGNCQRTR